MMLTEINYDFESWTVILSLWVCVCVCVSVGVGRGTARGAIAEQL